jgi:iron complex outermembrane receptor protein
LYFFLNTVPYDIRFTLPQASGWNITFGANGMYQKNQNKGTEFLVPAYNLFDGGLLGFAQKNFDKFTVSGGLRFDYRKHSDGNSLPGCKR